MKRLIAFILMITMALAFCPAAAAETDWEDIYTEAAELYYTEMKPDEAYKIVKDAEDCNYGPILRLIGEYYLQSEGGELAFSDDVGQKIVGLFMSAVTLGDLQAVYDLAYCYNFAYSFGFENDEVSNAMDSCGELYEQFAKQVKKQKESDDPVYPYMLYCLAGLYGLDAGGAMYVIESSDNESTRYEWYLKAAKLGDIKSMLCVAECYNVGSGVTASSSKAHEWYAKAIAAYEKLAEDDSTEAMEELADIYEYGRYGVDKDKDKAQELRKKAESLRNKVGTPLTSCQLLETSNNEGTKMIDVLTGKFTDIFGNTYNNAIQLWVIKGSGWANVEHIVYELCDSSSYSNPYTTLEGKVVCSEKSKKGAEMTITFDLDGVIVGSYYISTSDSEPVEYKIDVTGGEVLCITCSTEVGVHGYGLVTGELYK